MFFDDVKTLYDLEAPEAGTRSRSSRPTATTARARRRTARLARLPAAAGSQGRSISTPAKPLPPAKERQRDDRQARRADRRRQAERAPQDHRHAEAIPAIRSTNGELVFERTLHGLRNTVLLPAGWDVSARLAVGDDRHVRGPRVRRADQPERREPIQRPHSRAARGGGWFRTTVGSPSGPCSAAVQADVSVRRPGVLRAPLARPSRLVAPRPRRAVAHPRLAHAAAGSPPSPWRSVQTPSSSAWRTCWC